MALLLVAPVAYCATEFGPQQVIAVSEASGPNSVFAADLDGDGDVLSASLGDNKVAWYENTDGAGSFGPQQVITTDGYGGAWSVFAADLDGDGDLDVLAASYRVAWYENTDGAGSFGPQQVITTDAVWAQSVFAADLDGDGDLDVLSTSWDDDKVAWYENTDGAGSFGSQQTITTEANIPNSIFATDIDSDGDLDVLTASEYDDKVAWYENIDGAGSFGPQQVITTAANGASSVFAADLDGDGDMDVLSASWGDDKVAWYENTDGAGSFGPQQIITTAAGGAWSVFAVDLDGDGDLDVLSASSYDDKIGWYENTDGTGSFGPQQVITTDAYRACSVFATDLDGDGDLDVLSASYWDDKVAWYENTDGAGSFGPQQVITTITVSEVRSTFAADLDGDGDQDVLSASSADNKVAWYENTDGAGSFGPQQVITTEADGAASVFAADLDGDGDTDVLSASEEDDKVAWYENTDGAGNFGPQQVITTAADGAASVFAADLDGDGDLDVLSASYEDDKVAWYENTDGAGSFVPQQVITTAAGQAQSVFAADLDGDGDLDVLSASGSDDKVAWYENTDGAGSFGPEQVITTAANAASSVFVADLDRDGDMDVLSASRYDNKVPWYENADGVGSFGPQQLITTDARWATSVFAADLDGDGDLDVLSASGSDNKVAWYENTDGAGGFGPQQVVTTDSDHANSVFATDLDGDGDLDVLSASSRDDKVAWYENLLEGDEPCGDNGGELDLGTVYVAPSDMGTVTLAFNTTPNTVAALGFEVAFDNTKLTYAGFNRGALTTGFDFFDVSNPAVGIVRVGGFEGGTDKIAAGASGTLVELLFTVDPAVPSQTEIPLGLQGLVDDLAPFTTSTGCLITGCTHDGEINGDGVITPQDALLAYEFYLELTELNECEQDHADVDTPVDPGSNITPGDALCILQKYLGIPSCLD